MSSSSNIRDLRLVLARELRLARKLTNALHRPDDYHRPLIYQRVRRKVHACLARAEAGNSVLVRCYAGGTHG